MSADTLGRGEGDENQRRKYSHCTYMIGTAAKFNFTCLCEGGDGNGSAIMGFALEIGHLVAGCGWDNAWGTYFILPSLCPPWPVSQREQANQTHSNEKDVAFPETREVCYNLTTEDVDYSQFTAGPGPGPPSRRARRALQQPPPQLPPQPNENIVTTEEPAKTI